MRNPKDFKKVLTWSMAVITFMYLAAGIAGYTTYGNLALSPITLNMPLGFTRILCQLVVTIHVILAIPILITTFSLDMERILKLSSSTENDEFIKRAFLRFGILLLVVIVSITIPYFSDFMNLIGAVANTLLIYIFPVVVNHILFNPQFHFKLFKIRTISTYILSAFIVIVGIIAGICVLKA
jgi:amino acid permease